MVLPLKKTCIPSFYLKNFLNKMSFKMMKRCILKKYSEILNKNVCTMFCGILKYENTHF